MEKEARGKGMRKHCCLQMKVALTCGHKWARQIEEDENGDLYIWTYATDQYPYVEKKVKLRCCPFCGKRFTRTKIVEKRFPGYKEWQILEVKLNEEKV